MRNDGIDFELDVLNWMRRQLGEGRYEHRQLQHGQVADRPYEVDVHVVIPNRAWIVILVVGMLISACLVISPFDLGMLFGPLCAGLTTMAAVAIAKNPKHYWAEAKDRVATIKRTDILKLANAAADVCASSGANWKPDELWFVSRTGFDLDALNFAKEHQIKCFVAGKRGFKRVD